MFGIINKKYPGKQKAFEGFKRSLKETDGKASVVLFVFFILVYISIKQPITALTFLLGGWLGILITISSLSGVYTSELKENMIQINPPEQWKIIGEYKNV